MKNILYFIAKTFHLSERIYLKKMKIEYHDLDNSSDVSVKLFNPLINPESVEVTKLICKFISTFLRIRQS